MILHRFMLQIMYTTVFHVKRLNYLKIRVRLINCLTLSKLNIFFAMFLFVCLFFFIKNINGGRRDRDRMVVWFTTTYAMSAYYDWCCEFESRSGRGVLDTTLCDKVCQWLATGRWYSPGHPVSSTNKTDDCHDITELLWKVALNTITLTNKQEHRQVTSLL